jgi:hypothetical protein
MIDSAVRQPQRGESESVAALTAATLGYVGLLPFYAALGAIWLGEGSSVEAGWRALIGYAAVILSFVGAVHWGLVLNAAPHLSRLVRPAMLWGSLPALIAAATLLLQLRGGAAMLLLAAGFSGQFVADRRAERAGLCPGWYLSLRGRLTVAVLLALVLGLLAAPPAGS